jgi:Protein of unknown function (DUF3237)
VRPVGTYPPATLLERPNLPLPIGEILAGEPPGIVVGTPMAHPSDVVEVLLRRDGAPARVVRAMREPGIVHGAVQWFRVLLPALQPGGREEYRVEWTRAGRRMATLPADGSWYSLIGATEKPGPEAGSHGRTNAGCWPSQPRFAYDLEFFAALTVNLRAEILGATPDGYRINFFVKEGRVIGPRIDAVVEPEGGDWMCIRPDGIGAVHIKITYRTADGALILEEAGGVFDLGPDGYAKVAAGQFAGARPFYATPTWSTAHPTWAWLNRCQGFGFGRVVMEKLQVQCDIYIPSVGERIAGG